MGTTWYDVDPSSNRGSVTFSSVGLLSNDGTTLIGTAEGTLPGVVRYYLIILDADTHGYGLYVNTYYMDSYRS
jgi:hypothetical protein